MRSRQNGDAAAACPKNCRRVGIGIQLVGRDHLWRHRRKHPLKRFRFRNAGNNIRSGSEIKRKTTVAESAEFESLIRDAYALRCAAVQPIRYDADQITKYRRFSTIRLQYLGKSGNRGADLFPNDSDAKAVD